MNHAITTTLSEPIYHFLKEESKAQKTSLKAIIESALKEYKKKKIIREVEEAFKDPERQKEQREICSQFREVQLQSLRL